MHLCYILRKIILVVFVLGFCISLANAKAKPGKKGNRNIIAFHAAQIYVPGSVQIMAPESYFDDERISVPNQKGLSYDRKIYKNLHAGLEYNWWQSLRLVEERETADAYYSTYWKRYQVADLNISYRYDHFKHHRIAIGGGPSYTRGRQKDYTRLKLPPPVRDLYASFYHRTHSFGAQAFVRYDYVFLHDQISIGAEIKYRKYDKLPYSQVNYGLYVGFNF